MYTLSFNGGKKYISFLVFVEYDQQKKLLCVLDKHAHILLNGLMIFHLELDVVCFFKCLVGDEHQPCPAPVCIAEDAYEQLKDAAQELNLEWSAVEGAYQLDPLNNHYTLPKP